jgi:hypothetical protein
MNKLNVRVRLACLQRRFALEPSTAGSLFKSQGPVRMTRHGCTKRAEASKDSRSLAGKVSSRLRSSSIRHQCRGLLLSSGRSGDRSVDLLVLSGPQLEGQDDECDAKCDGIGAHPPCQHDRPDERRGDQERSIGEG